MKRLLIKLICIFAVMTALLGVCSCASRLNIDGNDKSWAFVFINDNEDGEVEYCSSEFKLVYPDAKALELSCTAKYGKIYINLHNMSIYLYLKNTLQTNLFLL